MSGPGAIKIAFVVGEESGDVLGADLIAALRVRLGAEVTLVGVGGRRMQAAGLNSLFDPHEIALMGVSAVLKKLPRLIQLIRSTAAAIAAEKPDCLIIIDSPDFTHRVARRVRALDRSIPIINYVCPSVWAWRTGRAKAMTAYVDEVLAILPFEAESLKQLSGPPATYVGHRLANDALTNAAAKAQEARERGRFANPSRPLKMLCFPGSRTAQMQRHAQIMRGILLELKQRGHDFEIVVPTIERLKDQLTALVAAWPFPARIAVNEEDRAEAFSTGDVALACSGTVTLELALSRVPLVSIYRTDRVMRLARSMIKIWTASLPNLIADQPIIPEFIDEMIRPGMVARHLEMLARPGPVREAQLQGFDLVRQRMQTERPSGELAAERVLWHVNKKIKYQRVR